MGDFDGDAEVGLQDLLILPGVWARVRGERFEIVRIAHGAFSLAGSVRTPQEQARVRFRALLRPKVGEGLVDVAEFAVRHRDFAQKTRVRVPVERTFNDINAGRIAAA